MKKIIIIIVSVFILLLILAGAAKHFLFKREVAIVDYGGSEKGGMYLINQNNKYGFINEKGNIKIKADLLYAREFSDGLAAVKLNNLIKQECFIYDSGEVAFNIDIDKTGDFYEGMALIKNMIPPPNHLLTLADPYYGILKIGFINKDGKVIVKPKFKRAENFSNGLAAVMSDESKWGFINKDGMYEIEPEFDLVYSFNDGLAPVMFNRDTSAEYSYIDKKGNIVINPHFVSPATPSEGLILGTTVDSPDWVVCINYKGDIVFAIKGDSAGRFKDGLAAYSIARKWGFINREGKIVIKPDFDDVRFFSEGFAAVRVGDKWGFIDKNGKLSVNAEYDMVTDFKEGLSQVSYLKGSILDRYAYINSKGEILWKSW